LFPLRLLFPLRCSPLFVLHLFVVVVILLLFVVVVVFVVRLLLLYVVVTIVYVGSTFRFVVLRLHLRLRVVCPRCYVVRLDPLFVTHVYTLFFPFPFAAFVPLTFTVLLLLLLRLLFTFTGCRCYVVVFALRSRSLLLFVTFTFRLFGCCWLVRSSSLVGWIYVVRSPLLPSVVSLIYVLFAFGSLRSRLFVLLLCVLGPFWFGYVPHVHVVVFTFVDVCCWFAFGCWVLICYISLLPVPVIFRLRSCVLLRCCSVVVTFTTFGYVVVSYVDCPYVWSPAFPVPVYIPLRCCCWLRCSFCRWFSLRCVLVRLFVCYVHGRPLSPGYVHVVVYALRWLPLRGYVALLIPVVVSLRCSFLLLFVVGCSFVVS
jgi:hypothetical protein